MNRKKIPFWEVIVIALLTLCSCEKSDSTYSLRERVYANLFVPTYVELFNTLGNPGQFVTIRRTNAINPSGTTQTVLEISNSLSTGHYPIDKVMTGFSFGLGGLIVGTNFYQENLCYDLACPYCDRNNRRLTLSDNGYAKCDKCKITYDLNNYGVIFTTDSTKTYENLRGLYRYRIMYNGTDCILSN